MWAGVRYRKRRLGRESEAPGDFETKKRKAGKEIEKTDRKERRYEFGRWWFAQVIRGGRSGTRSGKKESMMW
jgi:hypothetical protein